MTEKNLKTLYICTYYSNFIQLCIWLTTRYRVVETDSSVRHINTAILYFIKNLIAFLKGRIEWYNYKIFNFYKERLYLVNNFVKRIKSC